MIVQQALGVLSDVQREAIELAYLSGLTKRETADRTATMHGTVKSRMRLGLPAMRRSLEAGMAPTALAAATRGRSTLPAVDTGS